MRRLAPIRTDSLPSSQLLNPLVALMDELRHFLTSGTVSVDLIISVIIINSGRDTFVASE